MSNVIECINKVFILLLFCNVNFVVANEVKLNCDVSEATAKVGYLHELYNNRDYNGIYQIYTEKLKQTNSSQREFLSESALRRKTLGKFIDGALLFKECANPKLIFLAYQSRYEKYSLIEFLGMTHDRASDAPKIDFFFFDINGVMISNENKTIKNDIDIHKVNNQVSEIRELYNHEKFLTIYQKATAELKKITTKDAFSSKMTAQKNKLGKCVNTRLVFSQHANPDSIYLTYISQYEKYAILEIFWFTRKNSNELFSLNAYNVSVNLM